MLYLYHMLNSKTYINFCHIHEETKNCIVCLTYVYNSLENDTSKHYCLAKRGKYKGLEKCKFCVPLLFDGCRSFDYYDKKIFCINYSSKQCKIKSSKTKNIFILCTSKLLCVFILVSMGEVMSVY